MAFRDDDELFEPPLQDDDLTITGGGGADATQNRTFLIASAVLAGVFVLGLCAALAIILTRGAPGGGAEATSIAQENATRIAAATQTALAAQFTATPTTTQAAVATETATSIASATPTPLLVATQTEPAAAAGEFATLSQTQIAQGTTTPFQTIAPSPTAQPTLEVTQIGGPAGLPTPTRIVSGVGGTGGTGGTGAVVTATALPSTGLGIGSGVAGIGLLALVLVAVVIVARRLRLS